MKRFKNFKKAAKHPEKKKRGHKLSNQELASIINTDLTVIYRIIRECDE